MREKRNLKLFELISGLANKIEQVVLFFVDKFNQWRRIFLFLGLVWSTLLFWYSIKNSTKIEIIWQKDDAFFFAYILFWIGLVIVVWRGVRALFSFLEKVLVYPYLSAIYWLKSNSESIEKIEAGRVFVRRIFSSEELQWAVHQKYNHIDMYSIFARLYKWEDAMAVSGGSLEAFSSKVHEDFVHFWLVYYPDALRPFLQEGGACLDPLGVWVVPFCSFVLLWMIWDTIQYPFLSPESLKLKEHLLWMRGLAVNVLYYTWLVTIPWNEQMRFIQESFYPSMEKSEYKFEEYLKHSKETLEGAGYPDKLKTKVGYLVEVDGKKEVIMRDWYSEIRPVPLQPGWESRIPKGPK